MFGINSAADDIISAINSSQAVIQFDLEGKIQSREWNDKQGVKKTITEIIAESYQITQKKEAINISLISSFSMFSGLHIEML